MAKVRLKGQLISPIAGQSAAFATITFISTINRDIDLLSDSYGVFTTDDQGNYDFEVYEGEYKLETKFDCYSNVIKRGTVIVSALADGLDSINLSELVGYQEVPELDAITEALRQQKQELQLIEQNVEEAKNAAEKAQVAAEASATEAALKNETTITLYVNKSGNDVTGDGTASKPFATIGHAVSVTPDNCFLTIIARGADTKFLAHEIAASIDIKQRYLRVDLYNDYLNIVEGFSDVFVGSSIYGLDFSGGIITLSGNRTFYLAKKKSNFTISNSKFLLPDDSTFRLMGLGDTSISTLSTHRVQMRNSNDSAEAAAVVRAISGSVALINHNQSSLGTQYRDGGSVSVNIVGGLTAVSNNA